MNGAQLVRLMELSRKVVTAWDLFGGEDFETVAPAIEALREELDKLEGGL